MHKVTYSHIKCQTAVANILAENSYLYTEWVNLLLKTVGCESFQSKGMGGALMIAKNISNAPVENNEYAE